MEDKMYHTVVNFIKEEIKIGHLQIGDKLPTERELSEILELGRNSIREALRALSSLGIIESRQGSGNYLTGDISKFFTESFSILTIINKTSPIEINQMRRGLEIEALHQLISVITPDQIEELQRLTDLIDSTDSWEQSQNDLCFHKALIDFCGNSMMKATMKALADVFLNNVDKNLRKLTDEGRRMTRVCHHKIVDALREHNFQKGLEAICTHYDIVNGTMTHYLEQM